MGGTGGGAPLDHLPPPAAHGATVGGRVVDPPHGARAAPHLELHPGVAPLVAFLVVPDGMTVAGGLVEDCLAAELAQSGQRPAVVEDGDRPVIVAMRGIDRQGDEVGHWQMASIAAGRPARGPAVWISRAKLVGTTAAHAAAIEIDAVGINDPMRLDVVDDVEHVGLRQSAVAAGAPAPKHGEIERPGVCGHAGRMFEVVARVTVHINRKGWRARRVVVRRNRHLEGLPGSVGRRFVSPFLHAAERG